MAYKVLILDDAKADIKDARTFYRKILQGLNQRFTTDLKTKVSEIKNHPFTFGYRFDGFRTANLSVFPYQIHYMVNQEDLIIIIFAVLHSYRDPEYIRARITI